MDVNLNLDGESLELKKPKLSRVKAYIIFTQNDQKMSVGISDDKMSTMILQDALLGLRRSDLKYFRIMMTRFNFPVKSLIGFDPSIQSITKVAASKLKLSVSDHPSHRHYQLTLQLGIVGPEYQESGRIFQEFSEIYEASFNVSLSDLQKLAEGFLTLLN